MENTATAEQNVLQLNGVAIDVNVIVKDAEMELNNNDAIEANEKGLNEPEPLAEESKPADEVAVSDEKDTKSDESSTNTANGSDNDASSGSAEGDSKVDQISVESDEKTEPSDASLASSTDLKDEIVAETTKSSSSLSENASETNMADADEQRGESEPSSSSSSSTSSGASDTVTVTVTAEPSDTQKEESKEQEGNTEDTKSVEKSPKKSPKKKSSSRKRKNRSRSQKKTDYSDLEKYTVSVSQRQRRYCLFCPRGRNVSMPGDDCEIFCSNIPINVLEGELIPLFERYGKIWELRLMMSERNPKRNAGFAFVRFTASESAKQATESLNEYEIVPGKLLSVRLSEPNLSLFVGNIHRGLTREQIHEKISSKTKGLVKTSVKSSLYEDTKNCGFCFLEYDCHSAALSAKRLLNRGNVWGRQLFVDWAQRRKQFDENEFRDSKTLFINSLPKETTEQQITDALSTFGAIAKVTKIKDYAFVLFEEHQAAIDAINGADRMKLGNETIEISMAMPKKMKSRSRYPSFAHRRSRRYNSFNRFKQPFGSPGKMFMRKAAVAKTTTVPAAPVLEQTEIPIVTVTPATALVN